MYLYCFAIILDSRLKMRTLYEILHHLGEYMNVDYVHTTFPNVDKKFHEFYRSHEDEWLGDETQAPDVQPVLIARPSPVKKTITFLRKTITIVRDDRLSHAKRLTHIC